MAKRQNRIINYTLNKRIEKQYGKALFNVSNEITKIVNSFIRKLDTDKDRVDIEDVSGLIDALQNYSEKISTWAENTAEKMVYSLGSQDLQQWEEHSKGMSEAMKKELKKTDTGELLRTYMAKNVELIKSLPLSSAQRVHEIVINNLTTGKRPASVAKELMKTGQVSESRAMLIARTETSRAATGLVIARASQVGLNWYVWKSTHDSRLRTSHRKMDGVLCQVGDDPNPEALFPQPKVKAYGKYLPGATFNCRCWAMPLIRLDDITWPAKIFTGGRIEKMNKQQFMKIANQEFYKQAA